MYARQQAARAARLALTALDRLMDLAVLMGFLVLLAYGGYALWDDHHLYAAAGAAQYATYRPQAIEGAENLGFAKLARLNPEVIGWVTVYGTQIDYPVAWAKGDNNKYINTDAKGDFALSGCPFLDGGNDGSFAQSNNIIYGHHMAQRKMFGDLDRFQRAAYFERRRTGDLYFAGRHHGLQIFALMVGDAYDREIYNTGVNAATAAAWQQRLRAKAACWRDIGLTAQDRVVLLSTCASGVTNQRYILAARLREAPYRDPFGDHRRNDAGSRPFWSALPRWWWVLLGALVAGLLAMLAWRRQKKRKKEMRQA